MGDRWGSRAAEQGDDPGSRPRVSGGAVAGRGSLHDLPRPRMPPPKQTAPVRYAAPRSSACSALPRPAQVPYAASHTNPGELMNEPKGTANASRAPQALSRNDPGRAATRFCPCSS